MLVALYDHRARRISRSSAMAAQARQLTRTKLTISAPAPIVEIDTKKLEGELLRLSWAPDGKQMYLQTVERDKSGAIKAVHHYLLTLDSKAPSKTDQEPDWSTAYWGWKSAQAAPGLAALNRSQ